MLMMLAAGSIAVAPVHVRAHENYPYDCCHDQDCGPAESVVPQGDGSRLATVTRAGKRMTVVIPRGFQERPSHDGRMHVCVTDWGVLMCVLNGPGV
jgi:hypothetical protein